MVKDGNYIHNYKLVLNGMDHNSPKQGSLIYAADGLYTELYIHKKKKLGFGVNHTVML